MTNVSVKNILLAIFVLALSFGISMGSFVTITYADLGYIDTYGDNYGYVDTYGSGYNLGYVDTYGNNYGYVDTYGSNLGYLDTYNFGYLDSYGSNLGYVDSYGSNVGYVDTYGYYDLGYLDTYGSNLGYVDTYGSNLGYVDTYAPYDTYDYNNYYDDYYYDDYYTYTDSYGVGYSYQDYYDNYSTGCYACGGSYSYSTPSTPVVVTAPKYTSTSRPVGVPSSNSSSYSNVTTNNTCTNNSCNTTYTDNSINGSFNTNTYTAPVTPVYQTPPQQLVQYVFPQQYQTYVPPVVYPRHVALTQIPYTGFDLGSVGSSIYWIGIVLFALAASYLVLYYQGGAGSFVGSVLGIKKFARSHSNTVHANVKESALATPAMFARETPKAFTPSKAHNSVMENLPVARSAQGVKDSMNFSHAHGNEVPRIVINRG